MNGRGAEEKRRRRAKRWSWSVGEYGAKVLVFAERNGRLYGQIRGCRVALKAGGAKVGWPDTPEYRDRAKAWAREQEQQLREGRATIADPTPTVARVFAAYHTAMADAPRSRTAREEDKRCGGRLPDPDNPEDHGDPGLFARVFGADRDLSKLTLGEWQGFIRVRLSGAIDARGRPVPEPVKDEDPKRRPVRARTVEADCQWLTKVCNWALDWEDRDTSKALLREHPLRRQRFRETVPHEQNPRRPVATTDRLDAILKKANEVHPFLAPLLRIVNGTGRRISAVLKLRYEDLRLGKNKVTPHGAIQWPGETDKMGKAWSAPINADVRAALDDILADRPGLGAAYVFPSPKDAAKPMDRWFASKLLREAEQLAEVPHLPGGCWHPYRRGWATARKHLPIQDVAQAGGWKSTAVPQTLYMQPDDATLYRVVSEPAELREAKA